MERTRRLHAPRGPFTTIGANIKGKLHDLEELVADNLGIDHIILEDMAPFHNLQALYIPHNKLRILNNLKYNYRLYFLDARFNEITDIDLPDQLYLRELYLSHNKLEDLDTFITKLVHMRELQVLDLRHNQLTLEKGYRATVISNIPTLKFLDGQDVTAAEKPKREEIAPSRPSTRPQTVLQFVRERPLSAAEQVVVRRANQIRLERIRAQKRLEEEQTAVARRRKEDFEALANRPPPIPDGFQFPKNKVEVVKAADVSERRSTLRWFMKQPEFKVRELTQDEDAFAMRLNPRLPQAIFSRRMTEKTVFPK
jgi:hypothetical protein